jgi:hypothetical protein
MSMFDPHKRVIFWSSPDKEEKLEAVKEKVIGAGTFGRCELIRDIHTNRYFALKACRLTQVCFAARSPGRRFFFFFRFGFCAFQRHLLCLALERLRRRVCHFQSGFYHPCNISGLLAFNRRANFDARGLQTFFFFSRVFAAFVSAMHFVSADRSRPKICEPIQCHSRFCMNFLHKISFLPSQRLIEKVWQLVR